MKRLKFDSDEQANATFQLAFGRILSLCSRPFQAGDVECYEDCKSVILDACEHLGVTADTHRQIYFGNTQTD